MDTVNKHYTLSASDIKGLQKVLLELLVEFDRICRKHDIIYSIDGGTLLGAVRHGGFIPWDDDADVIMLRSEYEKFKKVYRDEMDQSRFYFQDIEDTKGYRWGYAKLRRKDSLAVRLNQEHMPYEQGIYLDVFVCDNVPENYLLRCICNFKSYIYRKCFWSIVGQYETTGINRVWLKLLASIPEERLKKSYFNYVEKCNRQKSSWVKCLTFPARNKNYGYKREWYTDVEDISFEGIKLLGCINKEKYLEFLYGDYMTPPSEDEIENHKVKIARFKLPDDYLRNH